MFIQSKFVMRFWNGISLTDVKRDKKACKCYHFVVERVKKHSCLYMGKSLLQLTAWGMGIKFIIKKLIIYPITFSHRSQISVCRSDSKETFTKYRECYRTVWKPLGEQSH